MQLVADARKFFLEHSAIFARQRPRIPQRAVPRPGPVALLVDLTFDFHDAIANPFARTNIILRLYHLRIAAAINAMISSIPNSMCSCTERINARFSLRASV